MNDGITLQLLYPCGHVDSRKVNKGLRELAKSSGIQSENWVASCGGMKAQSWNFFTPSKKAAKELAHAAYLIFAQGCDCGDEDQIDLLVLYIGKDRFEVPKKWQNDAIDHLEFDAYQNAGGTMTREEFEKDCQEPGGMERVFFEEGLQRDGGVMGRNLDHTSAPFDFFPSKQQ